MKTIGVMFGIEGNLCGCPSECAELMCDSLVRVFWGEFPSIALHGQPQTGVCCYQTILCFGAPTFEGYAQRCRHVSRCLRPKSLASIDHAPGPIIATVPANVARAIGIQGSLTLTATHNSITAIKVPTIGVHRPIIRRIPAKATTIPGTIDAE